jgi:hypothetical protein
MKKKDRQEYRQQKPGSSTFVGGQVSQCDKKYYAQRQDNEHPPYSALAGF